MIHLRASRNKLVKLVGLDELALVLGLSRSDLDKFLREKATHFGHFEIPKIDGTSRPIDYPKKGLKKLQRIILQRLYDCLHIPSYLHGGLPNRTVFSHARTHLKKSYVSTFDIRNFYPSVQVKHIRPVLIEAGFDGAALSAVTDLVTLDGRVPQGCPTSSLLANLAFVYVEHKVRKYAKRHQWSYSRFVDDIAVSSATSIAPLAGIINSCFMSQGFSLAKGKTHHFDQSQRQIVTNLVVNAKLRPTPEFTKELRHTIQLCLEIGPLKVATSEGLTVRAMKRRLNGRIGYLKGCSPETADKLKRRMCGVDWTGQSFGTAKPLRPPQMTESR